MRLYRIVVFLVWASALWAWSDLRSITMDFTYTRPTRASAETGKLYPVSLKFHRTVFLTKEESDRLGWARYRAYALIGMALVGVGALAYLERRAKSTNRVGL
jgi:hypothetical protein